VYRAGCVTHYASRSGAQEKVFHVRAVRSDNDAVCSNFFRVIGNGPSGMPGQHNGFGIHLFTDAFSDAFFGCCIDFPLLFRLTPVHAWRL
jgi:hypothetical protein